MRKIMFLSYVGFLTTAMVAFPHWGQYPLGYALSFILTFQLVTTSVILEGKSK